MKNNLLNNLRNLSAQETKEFYVRENIKNEELIDNIDKVVKSIRETKMIFHTPTQSILYFGDDMDNPGYCIIDNRKYILIPINKNDITFTIVNATYIVSVSKKYEEKMMPVNISEAFPIPYINYTIGNYINYDFIESYSSKTNQSIEEIDIDTFDIREYLYRNTDIQLSLAI